MGILDRITLARATLAEPQPTPAPPQAAPVAPSAPPPLPHDACCSLAAAHPDIAAIDDAIRADDEHHRAIAQRFHTNPSAVYRHIRHVRADGYVTPPTPPALPPQSPQDAAQAARAFMVAAKVPEPQDAPREAQQPANATDPPTASPDTQAETSETVAEASFRQSRAKLAAEPARRVFMERVETVANIIALAEWRDRATVIGLSERWQISQDEVYRIYRVAAARVHQARGSQQAQLEVSIALQKKQRDAELAVAKEYDEQVSLHLKAKKFTAARGARKMAALCRRNAMGIQKQIDAITVAKPATLVIQVGAQADPDFALAWRVVTRVLDARFAGASALVEEGLAVLEDGGEAAFDRWLLAADTAVSLVADASGTYALPETTPARDDIPDAEVDDNSMADK